MTVETIMSRQPVTISPDTTVARAVLEMNRHQIHNIPVIDAAGSFVGLFSLRRLAHALLPMAAQLDEETFHLDIGFLSDTSDEFIRRLQSLGRQPVSQLLEKKKKLRFCKPSTTIPRLLQLLSENPASLPVVVVEGKQKRVVGMVSAWDVLNKIALTLLANPDMHPGTLVDHRAPGSGREPD
jgi:CBS domain-containing protein